MPLGRKALRLVSFAIGASVASSLASAQTSPACANREECLMKVVEAQWDFYETDIERSWTTFKRVQALLERARASGNAAAIAEAEKLHHEAERRWAIARGTLEALTDPAYRQRLTSDRAQLAGRTEEARAHLHAITELFRRLERTTTTAERESILRQLSGIATDAQRQRTVYIQDVTLGALKIYANQSKVQFDKIDARIKAGDLPAISASSRAYLEAMKVMSGKISFAAESTKTIAALGRELEKGNVKGSLLEAAKLGYGATMELAGELHKYPFPDYVKTAARRAALYGPLIATSLDFALFAQTTYQQRQLLERQSRVEASDSVWRMQVRYAGIRHSDLQMQLSRSDRTLERQAKLEALKRRLQ